LNVWSIETPRYPAWLQGVWQNHSRHVKKAPKHLEILGRATRRAPYREAFIPDVNPGEVFRAGEGDDGVGGRSSDLTNATTKPEEGLAT
jgi:hypothetical protein